MFNALRYTEELEKAGFSRSEAEASLKILIEVMNENFATKSDLKELELRMDHRFQGLTQNIESKFQAVDAKFAAVESSITSRFAAVDARFNELEYKLTIKLGSMMAIAVGVTATLVQLIK